MAVRFKKVKRKVLGGDDAGTYKYYGMARSTGVTGLKEICNLICARASFSPADVRSMLESLDWVMDHELRGGRTVKLGELGTFRMSLRSEGAITEKEFTAHKIKRGRIIFTPGATLREVCAEVTFEPFDTPKQGDEENEGGEDSF